MDLIDASAAKNPKLMLRRTESVVEKMLTNWMSICMYSCLRVRAPAASARRRLWERGWPTGSLYGPGNRASELLWEQRPCQEDSPLWHAFESSSATSLLGGLEQLACPL